MEKVALITGAARGIGKATAELFLENGYHAILLDRDEEALMETHQALENTSAYCTMCQTHRQVAKLPRVLHPNTGDWTP